MAKTISLNDGKKIPALAWGNGTGGINDESKKAIELGKAALQAGILHIDTAQVGAVSQAEMYPVRTG
jgi:diketogulonate reductase-like aldo/keto reductase